MNEAFRLPLIPIFIVYTLGIYFGHLDLPFLSQAWIPLLILFGFWIFFLITKRARMGSWTAVSIFFLLGIFSIQLYLHPRHPPSHISHFTGLERISLEGIIDRPPESSREEPSYSSVHKRSFCRTAPSPWTAFCGSILERKTPRFEWEIAFGFVVDSIPPVGFTIQADFPMNAILLLTESTRLDFCPRRERG